MDISRYKIGHKNLYKNRGKYRDIPIITYVADDLGLDFWPQHINASRYFAISIFGCFVIYPILWIYIMIGEYKSWAWDHMETARYFNLSINTYDDIIYITYKHGTMWVWHIPYFPLLVKFNPPLGIGKNTYKKSGKRDHICLHSGRIFGTIPLSCRSPP